MAKKLDLLSLPDELLEKIVMTAFPHPVLKDWDWITLALTCRRLWKVQLSFDLPTISKWECLKWYLKHYQGAKLVRIKVVDWPTDDIQLKELANSLREVSCDLKQMERLSQDPLERLWRAPQPLSPWITAMLTGASNLTHLRLSVEMLPCLPTSKRKSLETLHIDAKDNNAVRDAIQAVMDYQQMRSLTIVCLNEGRCGWDSRIPKLDLGHLVHLRNCHLKYLPAPHGVVLSQGKLEVTILPEHIGNWSKLWHQIQPHVDSITIERCPDSWLFSLSGWPQGIDAFHGLQFLQLNCGEVHEGAVGRDSDRDALDLACVAYIPHVSLWCKGSMILKISKGSWRVVEVYCGGFFSMHIDDAKAFMEGTTTFSFTFNSALSRDILGLEVATLIKELREAGVDTGIYLV